MPPRSAAPLLLAALAALSLAPVAERSPLLAQAAESGAPARAGLAGRVTTPSGAAVVDARVEARALDGRAVRETRTNADGRFAFEALPAGRWGVRVQAVGFAASPALPVTVGARAATLDVTLQPAVAQLAETVVSATRVGVAAASVSSATTVLDRETLQRELTVTPGLADALGRLVPGLAVGNQSMSVYGQAMRGRSLAVLVDGVPLSTSRNVARDLATVDPAVIERVEVIRGASAIYGDGATGGVINIVTRRAGGAPAFHSQLATGASLTSELGEGRMLRATQGATGTVGALDYAASATLARQGLAYDADGAVIPVDPNGQGGLADTESWDLFAKLGWTRGGTRAQLTVNSYDLAQDTEWATAATADTAGKATAVRGLDLATPQMSRNRLVSLDLSRDQLLGGPAAVQLYWRDYVTRFSPFTLNVSRPSTGSSTAQRYPLQSYVESEKIGLRAQQTTLLGTRGAPVLTWGFDAVRETTEQRLNVFDGAQFDASGGRRYRRVDEWSWVPPLDVTSAAAFAQLVWTPVERLTLNGGVRHERARAQVDDFSTIAENPVAGGTLRYSPTLFNAGAVVRVGRGVDAVANFSQGFSLADVGRVLRGAPAGFVLGSQATDAQRVDQYELGLRGGWQRVRAELVGFRNTSDLGTQLDAELNVVRAPERVYGVEGTMDVRATERLTIGAVGNWSEGDYEDAATGEWRPLNGYRIAPWKATGWAEYALRPGWTLRGQLLHSGARDRAARDGAAFGGRAVESFTTVDASAALPAGPGRLTIGVENLFNALYFPPVSQLLLSNTAATRAAARGRMLSLTYDVSW